MRVLVCGSRTWTDEQFVYDVLGGMNRAHGIEAVIEGGARGADASAKHWARANKSAEHWPYPADWGRYGKRAGHMRNQQMLDEGKPDIVLAFVDKPLSESRGTADMVRRARAAGLRTYIITSEPADRQETSGD